MFRYKYYHRLALIILIGLSIPVALTMAFFWQRAKADLDYTNQSYCQTMAETFSSFVSAEITRLRQDAASISVDSKRPESAFYQGQAAFDENPYWYYEAVRELNEEHTGYGEPDCLIYYYGSHRIFTKSSSMTVEAFFQDEKTSTGRDVGEVFRRFFDNALYKQGEVILTTTNTADDTDGDMFIGFCSQMGRSSEPVLIFYRLSAQGDSSLWRLAEMNSGLEFRIMDLEDGSVLLRLGSGIEGGRLSEYSALYEAGDMTFSVRMYNSAIQSRVVSFYSSTAFFSLVTIILMLAIAFIALTIAYMPIRNLAREFDLTQEDSNDELKAIGNILMSREKEIFEQRSQIMTLLLDNLISGGHISIPLAQMGVDLTGTTCFCVYLIGGQSLHSDDGDELIGAVEKQFGIRFFMPDVDEDRQCVAIAFLKKDDSRAIGDWIRGWLGVRTGKDYEVTKGDVVEHLDDIRASYISLFRKDSSGVELSAAQKDLQVLRQKEERRKRQQEAILAYIDENYRDANLSQTMVADAFQISTFTLSRLFRNQIGIGFTEYVNTRRVTLAKQLLLTTDMPTKRIAEECGLPNYNYFLRLFKTLTGYSPTAFRHRKETED